MTFGDAFRHLFDVVRLERAVTQEALLSAWILRTGKFPETHEDTKAPGSPFWLTATRVVVGPSTPTSHLQETCRQALARVSAEQRILLATEPLEELQVVTEISGPVLHVVLRRKP